MVRPSGMESGVSKSFLEKMFTLDLLKSIVDNMPSQSGILLGGPSSGEFVQGMHQACPVQEEEMSFNKWIGNKFLTCFNTSIHVFNCNLLGQRFFRWKHA